MASLRTYHHYSYCLFPIAYCLFSIPYSSHKKESQHSLTLIEIRRRPTLPGRFQPSTISVLRLNFCVRDGNRWILLLPRTLSPSVRQYNCLPTSWNGFRLQLKALTHRVSAPSKPHRLDSLARPTKTPHVILDIPGRQLWRPYGFPRSSQTFSLRMDRLRFVSSASFPWLPSTPLFTLHSQLSFKIKPSTD